MSNYDNIDYGYERLDNSNHIKSEIRLCEYHIKRLSK